VLVVKVMSNALGEAFPTDRFFLCRPVDSKTFGSWEPDCVVL
jgi:hypothetical protein